MRKRAAIHATTLRARPATGRGGKAEIVAAVRHDVWPDVERGIVRPIVDRRLPMARAAEAHRAVEAGEHIGKVLLVVE
jgi:NADPH:quinone reductase-like Zn-dependent oxidoreductase